MIHTRDRGLRSAPRVLGFGLVAALAWLTAGCSQGPAQTGEPIDRELFIQTYVDLRAAALSSEERTLSDSARADVLARNGVTPDELLSFADVHGRDVEFMRDVFNEVELRLDGLTVEPVEGASESAR